jgi:hypothetical protein
MAVRAMVVRKLPRQLRIRFRLNESRSKHCAQRKGPPRLPGAALHSPDRRAVATVTGQEL